MGERQGGVIGAPVACRVYHPQPLLSRRGARTPPSLSPSPRSPTPPSAGGAPRPYLPGMDRLAALQEFLRDDPDDPFTRFALAQEHLKRGATAEALALYEGLVRDQPDYVGTYYHLGKLYAALGRRPDAAATYRVGTAAATRAGDLHARAELQAALLEAEGLPGFEDDDA